MLLWCRAAAGAAAGGDPDLAHKFPIPAAAADDAPVTPRYAACCRCRRRLLRHCSASLLEERAGCVHEERVRGRSEGGERRDVLVAACNLGTDGTGGREREEEKVRCERALLLLTIGVWSQRQVLRVVGRRQDNWERNCDMHTLSPFYIPSSCFY